MSEQLQALQKQVDRLRADFAKEIDAQAKTIKKLEAKVKDLEKEQSKLVVYVNNLMRKADNLIKSNYQSLRRTQVIDRQRMTTIESDVSRISSKIKSN